MKDIKLCARCKKIKTFSNFNKNTRMLDGHKSWCKQCDKENQIIWRNNNRDHVRKNHRENQVRNQYGLTIDEYKKLLSQDCNICGEHNRMHLDHCHKTGKIRRILCQKCNQGLGLFRDSPELLEKAAIYLREFH
jgi:hypothetical protein